MNTSDPSSPSSISLPNSISHPITRLKTDRQWLRFDLLEAGTSTPQTVFQEPVSPHSPQSRRGHVFTPRERVGDGQ
jgi:hypothetical protein